MINNDLDNYIDNELEKCLCLEDPRSFFLFAGAGSGKTSSLVKSLKYIIKTYKLLLKAHGQRVAVITYTNAAADEIRSRLDFEPLIEVSTIHSFIWGLIKGFNPDIKAWLKEDIQRDIKELKEKQQKGRSDSQAHLDRERALKKKEERLTYLDQVEQFIYNPNGDNIEKDSLNHTEVIKLGAFFISNKTLMQEIIIHKFPVLLIDESQDTNKLLIDAFFELQKNHKTEFILGLFGDMMQRIYTDGKEGIEKKLSQDWKIFDKQINHRSQKRIVDLINKIREEADKKIQYPRLEKNEGILRVFVLSSVAADKGVAERKVKRKMSEITHMPEWNGNELKTLVLEHRMAAERLGFVEMFDALYRFSPFKTDFLDGSLGIVSFFSDIIYPLFLAQERGNAFQVMSILKKYCPMLQPKILRQVKDQISILKIVKDKFEELYRKYRSNEDITFLEILNAVRDSELISIPHELDMTVSASASSELDSEENSVGETETISKRLAAIRQFLEKPFRQIKFYSEYVKNESSFATHQGVKGLEFEHVMVIMNDEEAGGFMFKYERLFGVDPKTSTDVKNANEGKETMNERTRRLFYVACSRAKESLALVVYSKNPQQVKQFMVEHGWVSSEEVIESLE